MDIFTPGLQGPTGAPGPAGSAGSGSGDVVGPASSVDSEIALFNSTTGKLLKRASLSGLVKATSGVASAAIANTDYVPPFCIVPAAVGNGIADDTAVIQAALNTGKAVYLPKGIYLISSALDFTVAGTQLIGAGRGATVIYQNTLNAKVLNITTDNCKVSHVGLDYNGTPTAGATALYSSGGSTEFHSFVVNKAYIGVHLNDSIQFCHHFAIYNYVSIGLHCQAGGDIFVSDFLIDAINSTNGALGGIRLSDFCEACTFLTGDVLNGVYSIVTAATVNAAGSRPAYNTFLNCYFDTATLGGYLDRTYDTEFIGCWFSAGRSGAGNPGVRTLTTGDLHFISCRFHNCGSHGIHIQAGSIRTVLIGCKAYGNSVTAGANVANGIFVGAGVTGFSIIGCHAANTLFVGTQAYGLAIDIGASNDYIVAHNNFMNNGSGGFYDGGTGANKVTVPNLGSSLGVGGAGAQSALKTDGVTLNKPFGRITMWNTSLAAGTTVGFTFTNSYIAAEDIVTVCIASGATNNSYTVQTTAVSAGSCRIELRNTSAGALTDYVVLQFAVIKGAVT